MAQGQTAFLNPDTQWMCLNLIVDVGMVLGRNDWNCNEKWIVVHLGDK